MNNKNKWRYSGDKLISGAGWDYNDLLYFRIINKTLHIWSRPTGKVDWPYVKESWPLQRLIRTIFEIKEISWLE